MFDNIGFGELLVIGLFILIFFGPKKIPDIARTLGKAVREFKKAMQDVQSEIQSVTGIDLDSEVSKISEPTSVEQEMEKSNADKLNELKFFKDDLVSSDSSDGKKNLNSRKVSSRRKSKRSGSGAKTKLKRK